MVFDTVYSTARVRSLREGGQMARYISEGDTNRGLGGVSYLLVIGHRAALAWILKYERMAFPGFRRPETQALKIGDRLLLYTTRNCFGNPTRDRGRVIGDAVVTSAVTALDQPVVISDRTFPVGCEISLKQLAPLHEGVEISELVPELDAFPNKGTWAIRLRRPLVPLTEHDSDLLSVRLAPLVSSPKDNLEQYMRWLPENLGRQLIWPHLSKAQKPGDHCSP
jgi:hypothetical protein